MKLSELFSMKKDLEDSLSREKQARIDHHLQVVGMANRAFGLEARIEELEDDNDELSNQLLALNS